MNYPFWVCGIGELDVASEHEPKRMVTLLDPGMRVESPAGVVERLSIEVEDITRLNTSNPQAPNESHVRALLEFGGRAVWQTRDVTLVCCRAGVSRSTAAVLMLMTQRYGAQDLPKFVDWLWDVRPQAEPNDALLQLGDRVMNLNGALARAGRIVRKRFREANGSPMESMGRW